MTTPPASWGRRWVQAVVQERDYLVVMFSTPGEVSASPREVCHVHWRRPPIILHIAV